MKVSKFEKTMERLREIVTELEKDDLPLERALELYEEGVKISKAAEEILTKAEMRVREMQK